jgi:hypothetical protein
MNVDKITKDELINSYEHNLTVGRLKHFLNHYNLPDHAKVVVQRVEDVYFEKHHWGVYLKEGEYTTKDEDGNTIEESLEQYHPAWCCVKYKDDDDILFIDLHY